MGTLGYQKHCRTFINQVMGPHSPRIVLVLLALAMVMERRICFNAKEEQVFHPHCNSPLRIKWVKTGSTHLILKKMKYNHKTVPHTGIINQQNVTYWSQFKVWALLLLGCCGQMLNSFGKLKGLVRYEQKAPIYGKQSLC